MRYLYLLLLFLFVTCQSADKNTSNEGKDVPEEEGTEIMEEPAAVDEEEMAMDTMTIDTMMAVAMEAEPSFNTKEDFEGAINEAFEQYSELQAKRIEIFGYMSEMIMDSDVLASVQKKIDDIRQTGQSLQVSQLLDFESKNQNVSRELIYRSYNQMMDENRELMDRSKDLDRQINAIMNRINGYQQEVKSFNIGVDEGLKWGSSYTSIDVDEKYGSPTDVLMQAVIDQDKEKVSGLLEMGVSPDYPGMFSPPNPLMQACRNGDLEIVNRLIEAGADINATGESETYESMNALYYAATGNHADIVKLLIEKGARLSGNELNNTNNAEIVKALLENGADPNTSMEGYEGHYGQPVLWSQVERGNFEIVELLLKAGADEGPCWYLKSTDDYIPNYVPCADVENPEEEKIENIWNKALGQLSGDRKEKMTSLLNQYLK